MTQKTSLSEPAPPCLIVNFQTNDLIQSTSFFMKAESQFATDGRIRAVALTVTGQGKELSVLSSVPEGMEIEIGNVSAALVDSSGVGILIRGRPIVVVADVALLVPFVELNTFNSVLADVNRTFQPGGLQNPAAVARVTAEAALRFLGEDNPTLLIHDQILTRSPQSRQGIAEFIILAVEPVQSRTIVSSVVVQDPIDFGSEVAHYKLLVKSLLKAVWPYRRVNSQSDNQQQGQQVG